MDQLFVFLHEKTKKNIVKKNTVKSEDSPRNNFITALLIKKRQNQNIPGLLGLNLEGTQRWVGRYRIVKARKKGLHVLSWGSSEPWDVSLALYFWGPPGTGAAPQPEAGTWFLSVPTATAQPVSPALPQGMNRGFAAHFMEAGWVSDLSVCCAPSFCKT